LFFQGAVQPAVGPLASHSLAYASMSPLQKRLLSGAGTMALAPPETGSGASPSNYFPSSQGGCTTNLGGNIKVNQNCLNISDSDLQGRGQAQNETSIAQNPSNPDHILASFNDYRRGDGNCIGAYSLNGGKTWTDTLVPAGFTRGTAFGGVAREYWQAGGDTAVAWDTKGNAYFECMVFQRGKGTTNNPDASSAFYVFRSTGNSGASWNFPGRPVAENNDVAGIGAVLLDKPYMTVDNRVGSPFQDRIYVTWTLFAADGTAKIYEANSADYGEHFSAPVLVSGASALCPISAVGTGNCDFNQFSQPFTGPDGALYVAFDNYDNKVTGADNRNQVLIAKSTNGGASFGALVKVADFYDLPDCDTYQGAGQDPFRACVPEKGAGTHSVFRAANYSSGGVNPNQASQVIVTLGSYIGPHSKESNGCVPAGFAADGQNLFTGVKAPGACNNDILLSVSNDGGGSFTGSTTDPRSLTSVTGGAGRGATDQFWQWAAVTKDGHLAVSYFDRRYGSDETNGSSDISLSASQDLTHFGVKRVTSSSMPPPTQFPNSRGNGQFLGDYSGLSALGGEAHPLWMDTRSSDLFLCPGTGLTGVPPKVCGATAANGLKANDQDIFTASVGLPGGEEDSGQQ
jgi:hypothetical protein